MLFKEFKKIHQKHMTEMFANASALFITAMDKDDLWETYLESFPPGTNNLYRKRREFDCSCCKNFIRGFGNVVAIKNNDLVSIWDFDTNDDMFQPVMRKLSQKVRSASIQDVFVIKHSAIGTNQSLEQLDNDFVHTWDHFHIVLPKHLVANSRDTVGTLASKHRATKEVFKRSVEEINKSAIETVLNLIAENSLYRGQEWGNALSTFLLLHNEYHTLPINKQDNYCWKKAIEVGGAISRIRNHSIGVLLQDISSNVDIITAIKKYERIVAPTNYKRPKAIFTPRMIADAETKLEEMGLVGSLGRRHATIQDITINNVIWANADAKKEMNGETNVFDLLRNEVTINPKQFDNVPIIDVETFIREVLPEVASFEILLENHLQNNLVSLIAPKIRECPSLFKWGNSFSWAYAGNIADSIKQRVKAAGGNVEGDLRFSLQWNDRQYDPNDYDAHCIEPNGNHIYYPNKRRIHSSSGMLDVDIINPQRNVPAVENIAWTNINRMLEGVYLFYVKNYTHSGGRSGFDAEIEYDGQLYEFSYHKELRQKEEVLVAELEFSKVNGVRFIRSLPTATSQKTIWGIQTNRFHPVSVCMYSPNYWDANQSGNKHWFFMIPGCQNEEFPNGFFNEYLKEEFMPNRRVFEALGSKMRVEKSENQLSGIGFSSTKRNYLNCKIDSKLIKLTF
jgi:hypothetical protein